MMKALALAVVAGGPALCVAGAVTGGLGWLTLTIFGKKTSEFLQNDSHCHFFSKNNTSEFPQCICNNAQLKVPAEPNNFGRTCFFHQGERNYCLYFDWIDPQLIIESRRLQEEVELEIPEEEMTLMVQDTVAMVIEAHSGPEKTDDALV